jgi:1-deoxy-D-xylulose-5-phosphate synthase
LKRGVEAIISKIPVQGEKILNQMRKTKSGIKQLFVPGMFFEDMGIKYLGPVDGHDVKKLQKVFMEAKRIDGPVLVHVLTEKGRGYQPAILNPSKFHGVGPFVIETGEQKVASTKESYTAVFSKVLCELAKKDERIVAITAAMPGGTGLDRFQAQFPNRFYDVGIAEEHATTFAAGLAAGGMKPVFAVYSSFLQRAYDQIIHDVCLSKLPVIFAIDRAGLVGSDGETHQGVFDLSYLATIPNMTILSPKNRYELEDMLAFAVGFGYPIAIRYPRGDAYDGLSSFHAPIVYQKSEVLYEEEEIVLFFVGHLAALAQQVREQLKEIGYPCSLVNVRFVKPFDEEVLHQMAKEHVLFVTMEENVRIGGYGQQIQEFAMTHRLGVRVLNLGISDEYVEHGNIDILRSEVGLDCASIVRQIITEYVTIRK